VRPSPCGTKALTRVQIEAQRRPHVKPSPACGRHPLVVGLRANGRNSHRRATITFAASTGPPLTGVQPRINPARSWAPRLQLTPVALKPAVGSLTPGGVRDDNSTKGQCPERSSRATVFLRRPARSRSSVIRAVSASPYTFPVTSLDNWLRRFAGTPVVGLHVAMYRRRYRRQQ